MSNSDNFVPEDYSDISSSMLESIKTGTDITITKDSPWLRVPVSRAYYSAFLSLREEFKAIPELVHLVFIKPDNYIKNYGFMI